MPFSTNLIRKILAGVFLFSSSLVVGCSGIHRSTETSRETNPIETSKEQKAAPSSLAAASYSGESARELMKKAIHSYKLSNGLQVFMIQKPAIPMATVMIAVKNGSFAEDDSNNGLAHLYEHMFFKANEKIPSQPEFLKTLDEMGIELGPNMNAYTSTESVRYFFTLQSEYLKRGLGFMADAVITPKFLKGELEKERKVVIGEFDRYEASPTDVFFQKGVFGRLFHTYFVRKNVIGSRPVILAATQKQMHDIQHRYYIPNNAALFVVGEFDEALAKKEIEKDFSRWKPGPDPFQAFPVPEHPALKKTEYFSEAAPVQLDQLVMAFQGPSFTKDDTAVRAFEVAALMMGLESSPLQRELVHSGIASSASFFSWGQRYTSPVVFNVECAPENAQKAYDILMTIVDRVKKGGFFSEKDLQLAKNSIEVSSAYDRESGQKYALNLASIWTSTGSLDFYTNFVDDVKKLTMADIDRAMKTYLSSPYVFGTLMPLKDAKAVNPRAGEVSGKMTGEPAQ